MGLVLVIDDHDDTRVVIQKLLKQWGHTTIGAETAEAGLAVLATEKPDLIIVDGMMPGVNGVEFIRMLRANPSTATVPAILYTAIMDANFAENALEKGANEVWIKGKIEIPQMRERVAHYFE